MKRVAWFFFLSAGDAVIVGEENHRLVGELHQLLSHLQILPLKNKAELRVPPGLDGIDTGTIKIR